MKFKALLRASSAALVLAGLPACQKKAEPEVANESSAPAPAPAAAATTAVVEKTSFEEVARHLDSNGWLYGYLSAEQMFTQLRQKSADYWQAMDEMLELNATEKAELEKGFAMFSQLFANSGIWEISGFGMSSVAIEPGYYQTRYMLHHYAGKGNGFLWKLHAGRTNGLALLKSLPADTAGALRVNFSLVPIWDEFQRIVASSPELKKEVETKLAEFEKNSGLKVSHLLANVGPTYDVTITLKPEKMVELPSGNGQTLTIPEPAILIAIEVQDLALFQKLEEGLASLPFFVAADEGELKLRRVAVPMGMSFLSPVIAWRGNQLYLASNEALLREVFAVEEGSKPGMQANEELQKAIEGFPAQAHSFSIFTPTFYRVMSTIQLNALDNPGADAMTKAFMKQFLAPALEFKRPAVGAQATIDQGIISITRSEVGPSYLASYAAGMPMAIAIPNFVKARSKSKSRNAAEQIRLLEAASDQWALENNKASGSQPTTSDLLPFLPEGTSLAKALKAHPDATSFILIEKASPLVIPPVGKPPVVPADWIDVHIDSEHLDERYLPAQSGSEGGSAEEETSTQGAEPIKGGTQKSNE